MTGVAKRLRALTIVPDALYVRRDADRQLERVIDDMGRPAYILVARQMGKTNLLLHMKRRREAVGDVACYFDLSTRHATLQAFFRAIIDAVIDALDAGGLRQAIKEERKEGMEPNVEFDMHLRRLLEAVQPQRLILFLDEIDSLIGVSYSDKVLAQIRSMYFARDNYDIYNRLTYVLSGVAEPADLIKDKNISPFNIGEKVYLENFSLSELGAFLRQANLSLPPSLIERVFHWTSGNPRMSWDICSTIEDMMGAGEWLTPDHVDEAVERVYLRDFDRAPVDHVRTLVRADPGLRDALMSMHYGKGNTLDDAIRGRLFLAGITKSGSASPDFNNRVVAEALQPDWLIRLAGDHASAVDAASRLYVEHDYSGAVSLFEKYLGHGGDGRSDLTAAQLMQFGIALHHLQRFDEAEQRLKDALTASGAPDLRMPILFYLASAKLLGGDAAASVALFEEVASRPGDFEFIAKQALASALISVSARTHAERIISLAEEVVGRDSARADETALELTASALYNQALAHLASGGRAFALEALQRALELAPSDLVPGIYLRLIDVVDNPSDKSAALARVVVLLEQNLPIARRYGATGLTFTNVTLGALVAKALVIDDQDSAARLISLAKKSLNEPSIGRIAVRVLSSAGPNTDHAALRPLVEAGLADAEQDMLAGVDILALAKAGVLSASTAGREDAFDRYVRLVSAHMASFIFDESDGLICMGEVTRAATLGDHARMQRVTGFFDGFREVFLRSQAFIYLFYVNQKMTYYGRNVPMEANRLAQEIIEILEDPAATQSDLSDPALQSFVAQIETSARSTLLASVPDRFRKLRRNQVVRYRDTRTGQEKMAKFKKVERELRSGVFVLVSPNLAET